MSTAKSQTSHRHYVMIPNIVGAEVQVLSAMITCLAHIYSQGHFNVRIIHDVSDSLDVCAWVSDMGDNPAQFMGKFLSR